MNTEFLVSKGAIGIAKVLGITRQTATNYIRGSSCMSADHALKLARYYGVSLSEVVDPDYRKAKNDDLIEILDAENRILRFRLQTVRTLLANVDADIKAVVDTLSADKEVADGVYCAE